MGVLGAVPGRLGELGREWARFSPLSYGTARPWAGSGRGGVGARCLLGIPPPVGGMGEYACTQNGYRGVGVISSGWCKIMVV